MTRHTYINWNRLSEKKPEASKKTYMVAVPILESIVEYEFATFYKKGDTVMLSFKEECEKATQEEIAKMSAEERLLYTIFERHLEYEIPEDGFYAKRDSNELARDYDNETFAMCEYGLIMLSPESFWADVPLAPEGFKTEDDFTASLKADLDIRHKQYENETCCKIEDKRDNNPYYALAYNVIAHNEPVSFEEKDMPAMFGSIYHTSTAKLDGRVEIALEILKLLEYMRDNGMTFDEFGEKLSKLSSDKKLTIEEFKELIHKELDPIFNAVSLSVAAKELAWIIFVDNRNRFMEDGAISYGDYRMRMKRKYKSDKSKLCSMLYDAKAYHAMTSRAYRLNKLMTLGAPDVIIMNEFRIMSEGIMAIMCKRLIKGFDADVFGDYFAVNPDYTRHIYEEVSEDEDTDVIVLDEDIFNEGEDEQRIGIDYPYYTACIPPSYKFLDGDFSIFDNESDEYYMDENGDVLVFDDFNVANELAKSLSAEKIGQANSDM